MHNRLRNIDLRSYAILAVVALALIIAYLLYPHPAQEAKRENITEITYWTHPLFTDASKAAVEEFERRNPQYRVIIGNATARDATGDPTRFLLGVAGGVPPDLIYFDRFAVVEWASRGAFKDLGPLIERDKDKPDGVRQENFVPPAWNEAIYQGRNYGVADAVDTRAMFYGVDPLLRAGFQYTPDDPEVKQGKAAAGEARPPRTWEEICLKRIHATGTAAGNGLVTLDGFVRRPAVNANLAADAKIDLNAAEVKAGDVAVLISGSDVFRGRIESVDSANAFRISLWREQIPGMKSLPITGACEVKVIAQEGYMPRLTRFSPETGQITSVAFIPFFGNSWLYMFGWLNGGEFMSADGMKCTLDDPRIQEALQWLTDVYDSIGGVKVANAFTAGESSGGLDPFISGKIAMRIDSGGLLGMILANKPDLKFGVVPAPIPEARLKAGYKSFGWMGGFAYAIPSTAHHPEAAWDLLRWMTSEEANHIIAQYDASLYKARGQVYFPPFHPDYRIMSWLKKTFIDGNSAIAPEFVKGFDVFTELLPTSRYRPVTPVGQKLWSEHVRATEAAVNHSRHPYQALDYGTRQVQSALEKMLHPPTGSVVNWHLLIGIYIALIVLFGVGLYVVQERKRRLFGGQRRSWLDGFICASPWLVGLIVFGAGPILFSIVISFCHYDVLNPARLIGFQNYIDLMGSHLDPILKKQVWNDPLFWKSLQNTGFMIIGVPLGIIGGLALAVLLDSQVRGLHFYRTIYYLPAIVPAVASFILWLWIFDPTRGLLNQALHFLGFMNLPNWLQDPEWSKPSLILMGLWGLGGSMIIWLAGLKDIPESLYEAASIDGASRIQRFFYITIPMLSPYILFNLIMGMIGVFQIFESAFVMTDGGPADSTLFFAYKLFNEAFRYLNMGVASAMAWILFVVVLAITLLQLWLSKKWVHYGS